MDYVAFDRVLVNEGNVWNPDNNTVVIPYTGYYLIHHGTGTPANTKRFQFLYSSGSYLSTLLVNSVIENGKDTLGKTIIKRLTAGSVLRIKTFFNTFSDAQMQTTFMGLLLLEG